VIAWENLGIDENAMQLLRKQPAVHELCAGGFLRETVHFDDGLSAIPLQPLGSDDRIDFLVKYARDLVGAKFDEPVAFGARLRGLISLPAVSLVCTPSGDGSPIEIEASVRSRLDLARQVISCTVVQPFVPFALFIHAQNSKGYYRLFEPAHRATRSRILSIVELETPHLIARVYTKARDDEIYRFALSLLHDAVAEANARFRIARLFNVLECLASENKTGGLPSRKAVRFLLGFPVEGDVKEWTIEGKQYSFDIIELAGRLRDRLFHGAPFSPEDLSMNVRSAFSILEGAPLYIADTLTEYCKVALYGEVIDGE